MSIALLSGLSVGTAPTALYTAAGKAKVLSAILTNFAKEVASVTVLIQRADGATAPILTGLTLASNQAHVAVELMGQALAAGDAIMAMGSMNDAITATLTVSA